MLVLSRKSQESVVIGGNGLHRLMKVTVLDIQGRNVRLGFEVDADVPVHRSEVWDRICAERQTKRSLEDAITVSLG
jgi:carbon storage regulator